MVTGIVAITLLFLPTVSKFLLISTHLQLTVTCRNPSLTSTVEGEVVHVFACTTVFTGNPNRGPKFCKFSCLGECILHVLSCQLRSSYILLSESFLLIILNVQYPSPNVTPVILSFAFFRTFLNLQRIPMFLTYNFNPYSNFTNRSG